jgi:hypothetical protein
LTIIIAAKYQDGVMYCYDSAAYCMLTDKLTVSNKVVEVPYANIALGIAGTTYSDYDFVIELYSKYANMKKPSQAKAIQNVMKDLWRNARKGELGAQTKKFEDRCVEYMYARTQAKNQYLFSFWEKDCPWLSYVGKWILKVNEGRKKGENKYNAFVEMENNCDHYIIGNGDCKNARKLLEKEHSNFLNEKKMKELLVQTLKTSFSYNHLRKYKLQGKVLSKHTKSGLELLTFNSEWRG